MMSNEQFWNSITYSAEEYKNKYQNDIDFWDSKGYDMYLRILDYEKDQPNVLVKDELSEQLKKFKS